MYKLKIDLALLQNISIVLVLKFTLARRLGRGFIDLLTCCCLGSIVGLFNSCQLNIIYTNCVKLLFKTFHYLPGDLGRKRYNEKSD